MTVVIMDRFPGPQPPYAEWLRDAGADLVLCTARPSADPSGYAEVHAIPDYAGAAAELAVLELARRRHITALVATAGPDLVRAGALRDRLDLPGQGRAEAVLFADPVAMRASLNQHGLPTVPCGLVHRVSDVYWYAHRFGYPVRVRDRRPTGWPTVAVLRDEADLRAYTDGGLVPDHQSIPSLFVEPFLDDVSRRLAGADHATLLSAVDSAVPGRQPRTVRGVRSATGEWLVDTVSCDIDPATASPAAHRVVVRAQAGFDREEVVRWAS